MLSSYAYVLRKSNFLIILWSNFPNDDADNKVILFHGWIIQTRKQKCSSDFFSSAVSSFKYNVHLLFAIAKSKELSVKTWIHFLISCMSC